MASKQIVDGAIAPRIPIVGDALIPRRRAYREYLGIGVTTGWRRERDDPEFPKPVAIGPKRFGFRLSELQTYIASRPVREGK